MLGQETESVRQRQNQGTWGVTAATGRVHSINLNDQLASISCIVNHLFMSAFAHDANQSKSEMESYIKAT